MNKSMKSIAVVGCGWLGFPFAERMIALGWKVKGSTRQEDKLQLLINKGIEAYLLNLNEQELIDLPLFDVDYLLINVPPGRGSIDVHKNYPNAIARLIEASKRSKSIKKIVFISSTSVYGKPEDLIDEHTFPVPGSDAGKAILGAEEIVKKSELPYVILRFGGLAGPNRHPGRFLAGRSGLTSGNHSINYLHLEDAIGVVRHMFEHAIENEMYNVVAPEHPTKKEFYTKMARSIDLDPPAFVETSDQFKREISVHKLLKETGYVFKYPNPLEFSL